MPVTGEFVRSRFAAATVGRRGYVLTPEGSLPEAGRRGDYDLNQGLPLRPGPLIPAAVLVPLVQRDGIHTVLLTERTAHLADHAGQVAFPGGRAQAGDADPIATALRETQEEIGLPSDCITVIGRLDTYVTITGYEVTPVVGLLNAPYKARAEPNEVAAIFEVPLSLVIDRANYERQSREVEGLTRNFFVLPFPGHCIWGATAAMLMNLAEVLGDR